MSACLCFVFAQYTQQNQLGTCADELLCITMQNYLRISKIDNAFGVVLAYIQMLYKHKKYIHLYVEVLLKLC